MADTYITYTGNGSTTNYSFTFPYLEETDVKVSLDGTVQPTSEYSFANATTIQFNTAPANAVVIKIYRSTSKTSPPATFFAGSAIRAQDLNENFLQQLYIAQETSENVVDAVAGTIPDGSITSDKLASNLVVDLTSGTAGSPSLTFDANTGIYSPGEDQIALTTAGVGRLFISSDGKVGLNESDPSSYSAFGDNLVIKGTGHEGISIIGGVAGSGNILFGDTDAEGRGFIIYYHGDDSLSLGTNTFTKLRVESTGTVNITGAGTAGLTQAVSFNGSAPVDSLVVDSLGNVGIGTGSPGERLHIAKTGDSAILQIQQEDSSATNTYRPAVKLDKENTNLFQLSCDGNALASGTTYYEAKTAAGQHIFSVNSSQVVRIDSGGRLLINTGTELGGALLQVNGDRIRVAAAKTPASASAPGTTGEICWDSNYVYVCVGTNQWKRSALSSWP